MDICRFDTKKYNLSTQIKTDFFLFLQTKYMIIYVGMKYY